MESLVGDEEERVLAGTTMRAKPIMFHGNAVMIGMLEGLLGSIDGSPKACKFA